MKALIFENKVVDIVESEFPVASNMQWQDCDDSVKIGYFYINNQAFCYFIIARQRLLLNYNNIQNFSYS